MFHDVWANPFTLPVLISWGLGLLCLVGYCLERFGFFTLMAGIFRSEDKKLTGKRTEK